MKIKKIQYNCSNYIYKSMRHIYTIFLLFCSITLTAQNALQTFLRSNALRHATVGFELRELATGKTISAHNQQIACTPASVTKLITTATALEVLGADYTFKTQLAIDGTIDSSGVLHGNVYIIGGGDPTLGSRYFPKSDIFFFPWIDALHTAGIKRIEGNVIVDVSLYDKNPVPVLWLSEDVGNHYAAGVFPFSVFDNTVSVDIKNGEKGIFLTKLSPSAYEFDKFNNVLKTGTKDSIYFFGEPYSDTRTIYGTMRPNSTRTEKCDISNPPLYFQQYFSETLIANGIEVLSKNVAAPLAEPVKSTIIYTHHSPPLKDIAAKTNFHSINNYAEHIAKHLALQTDSIATFNAALQFERNFWTKKGIDMSGVFLYDGSGLSPKNAITAAFVCDVLAQMRTNKNFRNSLPVAGESGTVAKFLASTPLKGKARVKSGSFRNVQCYAGYISHNEKDYAFCIMVNNFTGARAGVVALIEQLLVGSVGEF